MVNCLSTKKVTQITNFGASEDEKWFLRIELCSWVFRKSKMESRRQHNFRNFGYQQKPKVPHYLMIFFSSSSFNDFNDFSRTLYDHCSRRNCLLNFIPIKKCILWQFLDIVNFLLKCNLSIISGLHDSNLLVNNDID